MQRVSRSPSVARRETLARNSDSLHIICPTCRAAVYTDVIYYPGLKTHCCAVSLCLICCWLCAFIPYVNPMCQDSMHKCPVCNSVIDVR